MTTTVISRPSSGILPSIFSWIQMARSTVWLLIRTRILMKCFSGVLWCGKTILFLTSKTRWLEWHEQLAMTKRPWSFLKRITWITAILLDSRPMRRSSMKSMSRFRIIKNIMSRKSLWKEDLHLLASSKKGTLKKVNLSRLQGSGGLCLFASGEVSQFSYASSWKTAVRPSSNIWMTLRWSGQGGRTDDNKVAPIIALMKYPQWAAQLGVVLKLINTKTSLQRNTLMKSLERMRVAKRIMLIIDNLLMIPRCARQEWALRPLRWVKRLLTQLRWIHSREARGRSKPIIRQMWLTPLMILKRNDQE